MENYKDFSTDLVYIFSQSSPQKLFLYDDFVDVVLKFQINQLYSIIDELGPLLGSLNDFGRI